MLNINFWQILFTIINILVLYLIFRLALYKPVMKVINEREKLIKDQFDNAAKTNEDAQNLKTEYQEKLDSAKAEADQIILNARSRAEAEHAKAIEDTRVEAEQMKKKAQADIENDKEKATREAEAEIAGLAVMAARKIMKTGEINDAGSSK